MPDESEAAEDRAEQAEDEIAADVFTAGALIFIKGVAVRGRADDAVSKDKIAAVKLALEKFTYFIILIAWEMLSESLYCGRVVAFGEDLIGFVKGKSFGNVGLGAFLFHRDYLHFCLYRQYQRSKRQREKQEKKGRKMRELREKAGLTQCGLAEKVGVQRSTVAMWETGQRYPRPDKLLKLEALFGVPAGDIIRAINEAAERKAKD